MSEINRRHRDLFNPDEHQEVQITIAGVGNIGSHTALALARMGLQYFEIVDPDVVEEHNIGTQAYTLADVGESKVEALKAHMEAINPTVSVMARQEEYTPMLPATILVSGVDNLEARREIAHAWHSEKVLPQPRLFIDGRMGGGQVEVHTYRTPLEWQAGIPEYADDDPCSARFIVYTSLLEASLIAGVVRSFLIERGIPKSLIGDTDHYRIYKTRYEEDTPETPTATNVDREA